MDINYVNEVKKCNLFDNLSKEEIINLLPCLKPEYVEFEKNEYIFMEEEKVTKVGIILSGDISIIKDNYWGQRTIIAKLNDGDIFGEVLACGETNKAPVSAYTNKATRVVLIDYSKIIKTCSKSCEFHTCLIGNMVKILANKNLMMMQKIQHVTRSSTRDKLLSFLSEQAKKSGNNIFSIPYNRQELADYLSVDRSAMSNELSKLKKEGLLDYHKNSFKLLN